MSKNDNTRSALRAALKQEDAALTERLAAATQTPASAADRAEAPTRSVAAAAAAPKAVKTKAAPAKVAAKPKAAKPVRKHAAATALDVPTSGQDGSSAAAKKAPPKTGPKSIPAAAPAAESAAAKNKGNAKAAADAGKKGKPEKVVRDSFSLPTSEHARIKALRVELGKAGRLASKSEVLRAGLNLLGDRSTAEVSALLDALPPVAKGKRSKKR